MASAALGTENIIATIPHRDVMILFADNGSESRAATAKMIRENEKDGRKPITDRLLRLLPGTRKPFFEEALVKYVE